MTTANYSPDPAYRHTLPSPHSSEFDGIVVVTRVLFLRDFLFEFIHMRFDQVVIDEI